MPVMAVNNENQHEQTGDYRSRPRWSAGKKMEAVLRLLRGEPLETLSRELGVEAHRQGLRGCAPPDRASRPSSAPPSRPRSAGCWTAGRWRPGSTTTQWTLARVAEVIQRETGVAHHPGHV